MRRVGGVDTGAGASVADEDKICAARVFFCHDKSGGHRVEKRDMASHGVSASRWARRVRR